MQNNGVSGETTFKVDVAPEMLLYKVLQSQAYDEEAAISEFVDNSIQSFLENKKSITKNGNVEFNIDIEIDSKNKNIIIKDNAGGIHRNNLPQAMTMGRDPNKLYSKNSLSVYGMGLKSSAIWFSSQWKLETSCIGSKEKLSLEFNLDNLLASNSSEITVDVEGEEESKHYTKITLLNHTRKYDVNFYQNVALPFLLETFFKFQDVKIKIICDDIVLSVDENKIFVPPNSPLNVQKFNRNGEIEDPNSLPISWEKNIDFDIGHRNVYGFVRIMTQGRYKQPGIRLLRNKRVIQGTCLKSNLPEDITGTKNKFGAQRFYGEIHLNEFSVNYQKTGFNEDLSGVYSKIKDILIDGDNFIDQANNYRAKKQKTKTGSSTDNANDNNRMQSEEETTRKPTKINKSSALFNALKRTDNTKLPTLYNSLCKVSLREHSILMYVGAWSFLEALSTQMGKTDGTAFNGYLSSKSSSFYNNNKSKNKDVKSSISDIHGKGNASKHSGKKYPIDGVQLHNDFEILEEFLIHCLNEL